MQPSPRSPEHRDRVDLGRAEDELRREDAYARDGHTARTLVRTADLRVVLVAMRRGASIDQHHTDHTAMVHVLTGKLSVRFSDGVIEAAAGELFAFERDARHAVEAHADSAFLLTLGWRDKD